MTFVLALMAAFIESFLFWPVFLVLFLVLWGTSENEKLGWSVLLTVVLGAIAYMKFPEVFEILKHPMTLGMIMVGYVAAGVGWASSKWVMKVKSVYRQFTDIRDKYIENNNLPAGYFSDVPSSSSDEARNHHSAFAKKVQAAIHPLPGISYIGVYSAQEVRDAAIPKIRDNKMRYTMWGIYWPTSVVWFICNDFVREIANVIYDAVSGRMQKIADGIFKDAV